MITQALISVEIKDDGIALHPLHGRCWITAQANTEIPRAKLPTDMRVRADVLRDIEAQLRGGMMMQIYGEVRQVAANVTRAVLELQATIKATPEQDTACKEIITATQWLARCGAALPPKREPPRIVRPI